MTVCRPVPQLDDGPLGLASIGVIVLADDMVSEAELRAFLPQDSFGLYATRVPAEIEGSAQALRSIEPHIAAAAARLVPSESLDAVIFSCTSGSAVIGTDTIEAAVQSVRPGVPVVTPLGAAAEALGALDARRIAILTPYEQSVHERMIAHYEEAGFIVAASATYGSNREDIVRRISSASLVKDTQSLAEDNVDAVFISCTALRCSGMIAHLESLIDRPVVTSNQASAWKVMQIAGKGPSGIRHGRLFNRL